jgi:2-phospho-L-lactate guanylyltransferase
MHLWAIIPVKPFALGKSRLAGVLDAPDRARLNRRLFDHVFETAAAALGAPHVMIVTPDAELTDMAIGRGAHGVVDAGELNGALSHACRAAVAFGASAILVLPSDLPFLATEDIAALRVALPRAPGVVIAPDRSDQATNALLLSPPIPDFFRFGPSSFTTHVQAARASGAAVEIVRRPGLAFDLDTPEDYRDYLTRVSTAVQ